MATKYGFGAMAGAGIGFPISDGTRILLGANYSFRRIDETNFTALDFSVGLLF